MPFETYSYQPKLKIRQQAHHHDIYVQTQKSIGFIQSDLFHKKWLQPAYKCVIDIITLIKYLSILSVRRPS